MEAREQTSTASNGAPPLREQLALFAKNFFKHPRMLGSIIPSSPFLIRRLLDEVDWTRARVLVEFGPGVGTITREILRRMHPEAVLIVLETNPDFVAYLRRSVSDPRLHVIHGSAATIEAALEARSFDGADYVVAGIPFSTIPDVDRAAILRATHRALTPDGALLIYQFSPKVLADLQAIFSDVERGFEPLNIPPAQLFYCAP